MPCYDPRNTAEYGREEGYKQGYDAAMREQRHNSPLASMLCEAMRMLDRTDKFQFLSKRLQRWWKEHQERDNKRKKKK